MTRSVLILSALLAALTTPASAQHTTTTTAVGSDFWTGSMSPELFQLHENGGAKACTASEVFVPVRGVLGFCMDANENAAGALDFEDAREICAAAGKRLPEPAEYKFACQAGIPGLNNMVDDAEWASNHPILHANNVGTTALNGVAIPAAGNGGCNRLAQSWVGNTNTVATQLPFRCVR